MCVFGCVHNISIIHIYHSYSQGKVAPPIMEYHNIECVLSHISRTCSLAIAPCRGRQGDLRASSTQRCLRDPCPSWRRHCLHAQASPYPLPSQFPVTLLGTVFICRDSVHGRETDERYSASSSSSKARVSLQHCVLATRHHHYKFTYSMWSLT